MKCLTICEPYASAFMFGPKAWENRSAPTSHRGWMLVHAGKSLKWMDGYPEVRTLWPPTESDPGCPDLQTLHRRVGLMLGVVEIVCCVSTEAVQFAHPGRAWASGPWCWGRSARRVAFPEPFPWRGMQGLFDVDITKMPESAIEVVRGLAR